MHGEELKVARRLRHHTVLENEETKMIVRMWRGTVPNTENANLYEEFLRNDFLPSAHSIEGYLGATVLRRVIGVEVEFTTLTRFTSLDAVQRFAGEDYEDAHVAPYARELLVRFEQRCQHFECVIEDSAGA